MGGLGGVKNALGSLASCVPRQKDLLSHLDLFRAVMEGLQNQCKGLVHIAGAKTMTQTRSVDHGKYEQHTQYLPVDVGLSFIG